MATFITPFTKYLNTNFVPSSIDRCQIQELLREPERILTQLNDEVLRLQMVINDLQRQRDIWEDVVSKHNRLLTPFRRLPDDVLGEIFIWCLPEKSNAIMSIHEAPLLLGRVCSRWRSVAYHTPCLWSTLQVPFPVPPNDVLTWGQAPTYTESEEKIQILCEAIRDWLARSGSCPLSLSLRPCDKTFGETNTERDIGRYLDILMEFSSRWYSLEISVSTSATSTRLASISATSVPMLQDLHLDLGTMSRRSAQVGDWKESGLLQAHQLRMLHLSQFPFRPANVKVNWSGITHFMFSDSSRNARLTIDEAYRIFVQCKRLIHCKMDIIDAPDIICPSSERISLADLESLDVVDGAIGLTTLFSCVDAPCLRSVAYHTLFWPTAAPASQRISPLVVLLSRNGSKVEELITDLQFFTCSEVIECFDRLPSLRRFNNKHCRLGLSRDQSRLSSTIPISQRVIKVVLDLLLPTTNNGNRRILCPHLQVVDLTQSSFLTERDVVNFVRARMQASKEGPEAFYCPVARLSSFTIAFNCPQMVDISHELEAYISDGLRLYLSYPPVPARLMVTSTYSPQNSPVKRESGVDIMQLSL